MVVFLEFAVSMVVDLAVNEAMLLNLGRGYLHQPAEHQRNKDDFVHHLHRFFFNESALRPIHSISRDVRPSVRHTLETTLPEGLESSGRMAYR